MKKKVTKFLLAFMMMAGIMAFAKVDAKAAVPAVTGLKQTDGSETWVRVSWSKLPGENIGYDVRIRKSGATSFLTTEDNYSSNDNGFYDLAPGSSYYVSVRAYTKDECGKRTEGAYSKEVEVVTAPKSVENLKVKQTKAGKSSASIQWNAVAGANLYKVEYYSGKNEIAKYVTSNKLSLSGLKKDTNCNCYITPIRKNSSDTFRAHSGRSNSAVIALVPDKLSYGDLFFFRNDGQVSLFMNHNYYADGYEYQFYTGYKKNDTKIASKQDTRGYIEYSNKAFKYKKEVRTYKVRVRAYKKAANGTKFYTGWTDWKYFSDDIKAPKLKNKKSKGIEVSWKKVSGADRYKVYASTNQKKGYKVVATTKKGSTVKATFKKYNDKALKSGKNYYVYVKAEKKVNGKWKPIQDSYYKNSNYSKVKYTKK